MDKIKTHLEYIEWLILVHVEGSRSNSSLFQGQSQRLIIDQATPGCIH